ncbi:hypothetical protein LNU06_06275 [Campylobacter sp. VicNov18]|nr:hypothetical protein [Campylobacter bilis]MCC8350356.1 hypothetical protein [Campylobacter bilis]MCC8355965.1 hypothetical protein [Campylobacter bilis]
MISKTHYNRHFIIYKKPLGFQNYIFFKGTKKALKTLALKSMYLNLKVLNKKVPFVFNLKKIIKNSKAIKTSIHIKKTILTFVTMIVKIICYKNTMKMLHLAILFFTIAIKNLRFYPIVPDIRKSLNIEARIRIIFTQIMTNFNQCVACVKLGNLTLLAIYKKQLLYTYNSFCNNYNLYLCLKKEKK